MVQRRPVRLGAEVLALTAARDRDCSSRSAASIGAGSSRPSSGRSSSAASTPTSGPSSAPTTPTATPSGASSSRWSSGPLRREFEAMQARVTELTLRRDAARRRDRSRGAAKLFEAFLDRLRGGPRARSRLRLGQLPVHRPVGAQGPRVGGDPVGLARPPDAAGVPADRARGGPGHRDQRLRRRAGPGDDLDRRDPVDAPPRLRLPARTRSCGRSTTSRRATPSSTGQTRRNPREADWPAAEFIVGNPPFLGGKLLRRGPRRRLRRHAVRRLRRARPARSRLRDLLAREGAGGDRGRPDQARRPARDAGHPRRRQPPGAGADQGDRRHLLRPVGRAVGPRRRRRPHQLRRPGRRLRARTASSTASRSPRSTPT